MAASLYSKCWRSALTINSNLSFRSAKECFPSFYSVFAPDFKNPILDKAKIKELLETEPKEILLKTRIKPCLNNISPTSVFYHPDVELLTNYILRKGKRELAKTLVREAFTKIKHIQLRKYNSENNEDEKKKILINPLEVFLLAVKNSTPLLWYIRVRKSGSWFKVPTGISEKKARKVAIKWLVDSTKTKEKKVSFSVQLAFELIAASHYEGKTINKKLELHKMCEANRGFVHYWWT